MSTSTHPAVEAMTYDERDVVYEALLDRMTVLGKRAAIYTLPKDLDRVERDRDICRAVISSFFGEDAAERALVFSNIECGRMSRD